MRSRQKIPLHIYAEREALFHPSRFPLEYKFIYHSPSPDIIAINAQHSPFRIYRSILQMRWRFGWKPLIYVWFGEASPLSRRIGRT